MYFLKQLKQIKVDGILIYKNKIEGRGKFNLLRIYSWDKNV